MSVPNVHWQDHASLFLITGRKPKLLMTGKLHALVDLALDFHLGIEATMIETDRGQMFCRNEIGYIGILVDRPKRR